MKTESLKIAQIMVIGIGGASRSGKSLLANLLITYFRKNGKKAIIFHQDDFVKPETHIPKIKNRTDWESPETIDFELYKEVISDFKTRFDVVIAEGLFAFYDAELAALYDKQIFVKISKKIFWERKRFDSRWGVEPLWYLEHIWKSHLKHGQINHSETPFLMVSGEKDYRIPQIIKHLNI